jgi:SAM-dependent methyltransferase
MACLEIGLGEGSIARHLATIVGDTGKVVGIDINPRFVADGTVPNLDIRRGDIATIALEPAAYDLVHARLVMLHVNDRASAMRNISRALKPGGVLLLEEPNLRTMCAVSHDPAITARIERVYRATFAYYESIGMDTTFGLRVPALLESHGFNDVGVYTHTPLAPGGSTIAQMRGVGTGYIATELIKTGLTDSNDITAYIAASHDARVWTMYYTTVSVWGYKTHC